MSKIDQLKEEIKKLECEPLIKNILKERDKKLEYVGKVFSSHSLNRGIIYKKRNSIKTGVNIGLIKITGIKYGTSDYSYDLYDEELIYRLEPERLKEVRVFYLINCIDILIKNDYEGDIIRYKEGNHVKDIRYRYEQTPEIFENLKNKVEDNIYNLFETSTKTLQYPFDFNSNYEMDRSDKIDCLKSLGYRIVELSSDEYIYVSDWHPFTYRDFGILAIKDSCILIENKIKEYKERINKARDWSCGEEYVSAYQQTEYERRHIRVLEGILEKIKRELD